jgi:hypothetical protein
LPISVGFEITELQAIPSQDDWFAACGCLLPPQARLTDSFIKNQRLGVRKMSRSPLSALRARTLIAFVVASDAVLGSSQLAMSAEADEEEEDEEAEELREVQVTGTRIIPPNTTATNPITSITSEEMARLGIVNVADALTQLVPQKHLDLAASACG